MPAFNPQDYETVAQRIIRFYADHEDGRIITSNETTPEHRSALTWVMSCAIFLNGEDLERSLPKATGWAFEIDGSGGMANKTSALENCETSAIGRALANANYGGDKRVSREEMAKVERDQTPFRDWLAEAYSATDKDGLKKIYNEARQANLDSKSLSEIAELGKNWTQTKKS